MLFLRKFVSCDYLTILCLQTDRSCVLHTFSMTTLTHVYITMIYMYYESIKYRIDFL